MPKSNFRILDNETLLDFVTLWLDAQKDPRARKEDSVSLASLGKNLKIEVARRLKNGTLTTKVVQEAIK